MRTVVGVYDREEQAQNVVEELIDEGFRRENISIATRTEDEEMQVREAERERDRDAGNEAGEGAAAGAGVGAVLGGAAGLLIGLGTLIVPGLGIIAAAGPLAGLIGGALAGGIAGGIVGALIGLGIPEEEAETYAEAVRRGSTLVAVRTDNEDADDAEEIMERFNPVDMERRAEKWRAQGWEGFEEEAEPFTEEEIEREREMHMDREREMHMDTDEEEVLETTEGAEFTEVEEELHVGKREIETGAVRVHSYVVEEPVEEEINLRREHVRVEREPVDREAHDMDIDFDEDEEEVIELHETREDVVVEKEPRVTEQIRVSKEVEEDTETVRETIRRREVEIEQIGDDGDLVEGTATDGWKECRTAFLRHYQMNYGDSGHEWPYYRPAYRYGYNLAHEHEGEDLDWIDVESDARRRWEGTNGPGSWNTARDAIHEGYDRAYSCAR